MSGTMEIDRRQRRRYDAGLASTYQLDHIRSAHGYRAVVVATRDGQMLIGSMDEPFGRLLAAYAGAIGTAPEQERAELHCELIAQQFDGESVAFRVKEFSLNEVSLYLGILASTDEDVQESAGQVVAGLERIFETT